MPLNILVTAVGGGVGQSILRALKQSTLDYKVIGTDIDPWAAGLYSCDKGYLVYPAGHEKFEDRIIEVCKVEAINVILPGSDPEIPYLADLAPRLSEMGIKSLLGELKSVKICRDKQKAYTFFAKKGLPFIKTLRLNNEQDHAQICSDDFPLIVKPFDGSASKDVHVVFNKHELEQFQKNKEKDYIVQEYLISKGWELDKRNIAKNDVESGGRLVQKDEISIQILLDDRGKPFAAFTSYNSLKDGVPVTINPCKGTEEEKIAYRMALALGEAGLKGPCNLQCKLTEQGPQFFEINPRFTGITAVRALLGFNEVEALVRLFYFNEKQADLGHLLDYNESLCCSRYITELVFSKKEMDRLKRNKMSEAQSFSSSL